LDAVVRSSHAVPSPALRAEAMPGWRSWREPDVHRGLRSSTGRLLLMFGRRGCGTCRAALDRVPLLAAGHVDRFVYLDAEECAGLLREFEVFHLPALFLFAEGRFHATLEAPLIGPDFGQAIERTFASPAQEPP
jgi:thioredoxin 1